MKRVMMMVCSGLLLMACNRQEICSTAEQRVEGRVLKISGPDTLQIGKTVPLLIEVAAPDTLCLKKADGVVMDIQQTYVRIGANLVYTQKDKACDCLIGSQLKTLIYFTPVSAGNYVFGTKPFDIGSSAPADTNNYRVVVR